jgi:hypothetical protein
MERVEVLLMEVGASCLFFQEEKSDERAG